MILLVDAGNSRIKWANLSNGYMSEQSAKKHKGNPLAVCQQQFQRKNIEKILLVHVLGIEFEKEVRQIASSLSIELLIVHSELQAYDIKTNYVQPEKLGADRFVALVAARYLHNRQACIVVDCGTAVTVDAMDAGGNHLGGVILAGLKLCEDSLIGKAKNLLKIKQELDQAKSNIFATTTAQGVKTGCQISVVAAIEKACNMMEESINISEPVQKIICGGDARKIHAMLYGEVALHDDLVLQGLCVIANKNRMLDTDKNK